MLKAILVKLKEAHSTKNLDDVKTIKEELQQKWYAISGRIYSETQQAEQANTTTEEKKPDVEDVSFEDVK